MFIVIRQRAFHKEPVAINLPISSCKTCLLLAARWSLGPYHAFPTHQELGFFRGIVSICTKSVGIVAHEDFDCLNGPLSSSMGHDFGDCGDCGDFGPREAQRIVT